MHATTRLPRSRAANSLKRLSMIGVMLTLAACGNSSAPEIADEHADGAQPPAEPPPFASRLPDTPLPLGVPLAETRSTCVLAAGVALTRIVRGQPAQIPAPLPCDPEDTRTLFGGTGAGSRSPVGPWVFHVLEIAPEQFAGRLQPRLAQDQVVGKETVSAMAQRSGALAAVNAGFFVVGGSTEGDPAGLTVLDGLVVSEAINGRTHLLLNPAAQPTVTFPQITTSLTATAADGAPVLVDGLNRLPGEIRNCGGVGGDTPTEDPRHDVTCTDPDEWVWFDARFADATPSGDGREAVIGADGRVSALRDQGGPIPADGAVLAATGQRVTELDMQVTVGTPVSLDVQLQTADGILPVTPSVSILNGGPALVRDGQPDLRDAAEGFRHPDDPSFGAAFVDSPNPRTFAGVTDAGRILLVVVDGRQPDWSVGLGLDEAVEVMRALGAVDAMNLDGGGSSTMVVGETVVNRPSDGSGERPVGDALLLMPAGS